MASETIVAVFDTAAGAGAAVRDLEKAGVPSSSIKHYAKADAAAGDAGSYSAGQPQGFWAWLLGEEGASSYDRSLYDRTVESGGTIVTVIVDQNEASRVISVLETHSPANLEERASEYGLADAPAAATAAGGAGARAAEVAGSEEVIPIAEETLDIGKRTVTRGSARIRRYVVERPVEEQVRLRDETVSIERRPVSSGAAVAPDAFTEKTVEVTETAEEAVVAKTARVKEEVVVRKEAAERIETVRDTVRSEEVEVDRSAGKPVSDAGSSPGKNT